MEDLINEAIRAYLARVPVQTGDLSLRELQPEAFAEGNEHLSAEIDTIVYGLGR